ncbi:alcohol dehydrogenase catalytic domain-containing protein [Alkalihalobacillus sp. LMS6]|uniref:zinc-dependent alcohol dehydrogenase n=1 Tax=Bacillaceae TaxID=186817 RepID=UPI000C0899FE|nr:MULTISPECIES: alcohol dehydrogenase catalytic domain-containing protein [Bacillaceae]UTR07245.1 alcohol dehydrogenase catalytic domain-containing protein [Alkalihalobacillus sp. LMS6]
MKEIYLDQPQVMQVRDALPLPNIQDGEVKIKLLYGGICGSDLSVYKGRLPHAQYPLRPGHEIVGEVIESRAEHIKPGGRIVVTPNTFCGQCEFCLKGKPNICKEKQSIGITCDGGFAEEMIVHSRYCLPIPDELSDEAAVLIEPLSVIVHGIKQIDIQPGMRVLIVGCGTEGLLASALAHHVGGNVTAIDINANKLALLQSFDDITLGHPMDIVGETFDIVIEAAGTKQSVESCFSHLKPGGELLLIGITPEATIPVAQVVRNEQKVVGSIIYEFPADFQTSVSYLLDETFDPTIFISKIKPFYDYEEAYQMALSGNYAKIVLQFKGAVVS